MKPLKAYLAGALALLSVVAAAGCANPGPRVVVLGNRHVVALDADDVVRIMRRAGFSDQEILDLGTDVRNALASAGAVEIRAGRKVEAILAADERYLRGTSRRGGGFIYDVEKRVFR